MKKLHIKLISVLTVLIMSLSALNAGVLAVNKSGYLSDFKRLSGFKRSACQIHVWL